MKAIAYMLNINAWSVYTRKYAYYSIGTPTLELFLKSYNEKYGKSLGTSSNNLLWFWIYNKK